MTADAPPPRAYSAEPVMGPIDHSVLEQLRIDLEDDDGTAVAGLVDLYVANGQLLIPDLVNALASGDTATAARLAHSLATPTAMLGALSLSTLLQRVQDGAHGAGMASAELAALADAIASEARQVVMVLTQLGSTPA